MTESIPLLGTEAKVMLPMAMPGGLPNPSLAAFPGILTALQEPERNTAPEFVLRIMGKFHTVSCVCCKWISGRVFRENLHFLGWLARSGI